jgi:hypothetical protein
MGAGGSGSGPITIRDDVPSKIHVKGHGNPLLNNGHDLLNKDLLKVKSPPFKIRGGKAKHAPAPKETINEKYVPVQIQIVSEKHSRNEFEHMSTKDYLQIPEDKMATLEVNQ